MSRSVNGFPTAKELTRLTAHAHQPVGAFASAVAETAEGLVPHTKVLITQAIKRAGRERRADRFSVDGQTYTFMDQFQIRDRSFVRIVASGFRAFKEASPPETSDIGSYTKVLSDELSACLLDALREKGITNATVELEYNQPPSLHQDREVTANVTISWPHTEPG